MGLLSTRIGPGELDQRVASDLRGLIGAFSAISVMALGLQLVLVGILKSESGRQRVHLPPRVGATLFLGAIVGLLAGATTLLFVDSTRSFETEAALSVGLALACLAVSIPSRAVLLGEERWRHLAFVAFASAGGRLATTIALDVDTVASVLTGLLVGEAIGTTTAIALTRRSERSGTWPTGKGHHLMVGTTASIGLMLLVAMSSLSLDRFLGEQAADFNESASVARLVFVLILTVSLVFFPAMARFAVGSVSLRRSFHEALVVATGTAVAGTALILAFPSQLLQLVGAEAPGASDAITTIRLLAVAFSFYGLAGVSLVQYIAHGSRFALCTLPLIPFMILGHVISSGAVTLAVFALLTSAVLLVVASWPALARVQPILRPRVVEDDLTIELGHAAMTVVIPSFNPGSVVLETIGTLLESFHSAGIDVQVIVVSDGSTDGSVELISEANLPGVSQITLPRNIGKGAALRAGFAQASTRRIGFVDADGDIDPRQLVNMLRIQEQTGADIVFGSKRHSDSSVSISLLRTIYSRAFALLIRVLFQLDIADTQTGIKLYSRDVIAKTLPFLEENGFALDLELFVAARSCGFQHFVEVPVELRRTGGSTVSVKTVWQMLLQTARIFWRSQVTLQYLRASRVVNHQDTVGSTIDSVER